MSIENVAAIRVRLAQAERAFERVSAEPQVNSSAAPRRSPGCERGCPICTIRCAVVAGALADLRDELRRRDADAGAVLTYSGRSYHEMAGAA